MNKKVYALIMAAAVTLAGCTPAANSTTTAQKEETKVETKAATTTADTKKEEPKSQAASNGSQATSNAASNASGANNVVEGPNGEKTVEVEVEGHNGPIKMKVTATENKIMAVEILSHTETKSKVEEAIKIPEKIVEKNSLKIDAISEATVTSDAIIEGVTEAIKQMGFNPQNFKK